MKVSDHDPHKLKLSFSHFPIFLSSIKKRSICTCLRCVEVCTHLYMLQAGFCWKCELSNWRMLLGITCGLTQPWEILGVLLGGGVYYRGLSCVKWAKFR